MKRCEFKAGTSDGSVGSYPINCAMFYIFFYETFWFKIHLLFITTYITTGREFIDRIIERSYTNHMCIVTKVIWLMCKYKISQDICI